MKVGNNILVPLKIYMLFNRQINDPKMLINILDICMNYVNKKDDFLIHRKLFYILANAELYKRLRDIDKMVMYRQSAMNICLDDTFENYMSLCGGGYGKNGHIITHEPTVEPAVLKSFNKGNESIFYYEQGDSSSIPCREFEITLEDIEPYRHFLEKTNLLQLIEKHFPMEIQQDIKKLK